VPQNLSFSSSTGQPINADLEGLNALQDLQKIVTAAGQAGLRSSSMTTAPRPPSSLSITC
jgi:hypothetical protein